MPKATRSRFDPTADHDPGSEHGIVSANHGGHMYGATRGGWTENSQTGPALPKRPIYRPISRHVITC